MRQSAVILTSVLLAKTGLTTGEIGQYETLLYLGTVLTFFWVNGLLQGIAPLFGNMGEAERKVFTFNVFALFCAVSAVLFVVLFFGKPIALPLLTGLNDAPHFGLFCVYLLLNLPAFPVEFFYLVRGQSWQILAWGAASFGLHLVALFVPIWLGWGLGGGILGLVWLAGLRFLWAAGLVFRLSKPILDRDLLRKYLRFAAPLMAATMAGHLVLMFDNWLVGWWYGDAATFAIYRYGAKELPLAPALALSLGTALVPQLTADLPAGMAALKASSRRLFHWLFPGTIVMIFAAKPLFPVVFNSDFAASAPIFSIYLLITATRVLLPNAIILAKNAPQLALRASLCELAVKVVLGFVGIYFWGLAGVAASAVLAFWVEKLLLMWWLERDFGVKTRDWLDVQTYLFYVAAMLAAFGVSVFVG